MSDLPKKLILTISPCAKVTEFVDIQLDHWECVWQVQQIGHICRAVLLCLNHLSLASLTATVNMPLAWAKVLNFSKVLLLNLCQV